MSCVLFIKATFVGKCLDDALSGLNQSRIKPIKDNLNELLNNHDNHDYLTHDLMSCDFGNESEGQL